MKFNDPDMLFSKRKLVMLTIPIVCESLLSIMTGLVDTVMVSSAGEAAVSAVSLVDSLMLLFISLFFSLTTGGSVVCSQYIGSKNLEEARSSAKQLLYSSFFFAAFFMLILIVADTPILRFVFGKVDADVFSEAKAYMFYVALSFPFLAIFNSCCSLLRVMTKSNVSLVLATAVNIVNVIGNAVLIYVFDMGAAGAAIATCFARAVGAVISLAILHIKSNPIYFEKLLHIEIRFDILKKMLKVGIPNAIEGASFHIGKVMISSLISSFGTLAIASNAVATTVCNMGWAILGSFGTAVLPVVGQCMGARRPDQAEFYAKKIMHAATLLMFALFSSIILLRHPILSLFSLNPETTAETARLIILYCSLTLISVYSYSFVPLSAFRAAGDTKYALYITVGSMMFFRVFGGYLLGGWLSFGLVGVYVAQGADWMFRSVCNYIRFRQGKWKEFKVI